MKEEDQKKFIQEHKETLYDVLATNEYKKPLIKIDVKLENCKIDLLNLQKVKRGLPKRILKVVRDLHRKDVAPLIFTSEDKIVGIYSIKNR
jgi:hypothetical protein